MSDVAERLAAVRERIRELALRHSRDPEDVHLLAVSKTKPVDAVREAFAAGQRDFGENHLQDALTKIEPMAGLGVVWHFIGPVQSNKTRAIAEHFDWVHSVDRLKIAERLSAQRPAGRGPINLCIQVNISGEQTKSGVAPDATEALACAVAALPNVRLRGLMAIPAPEPDPALQRAPFRRLRQLARRLDANRLGLDTLSMGMSDDLEAAVAEGATLVRVGTAIFGPRV